MAKWTGRPNYMTKGKTEGLNSLIFKYRDPTVNNGKT